MDGMEGVFVLCPAPMTKRIGCGRPFSSLLEFLGRDWKILDEIRRSCGREWMRDPFGTPMALNP
jgi:hypothetical protein